MRSLIVALSATVAMTAGLVFGGGAPAGADPTPILCVDLLVQGIVDYDPANTCVPILTDQDACFDTDVGSDAIEHVFVVICHAD